MFGKKKKVDLSGVTMAARSSALEDRKQENKKKRKNPNGSTGLIQPESNGILFYVRNDGDPGSAFWGMNSGAAVASGIPFKTSYWFPIDIKIYVSYNENSSRWFGY